MSYLSEKANVYDSAQIGEDVSIGIDAASSEFYDKTNKLYCNFLENL